MELQGKRILITGGSSGIGLALAQRLLDERAQIFITGRRADRLAVAIDRFKAAGAAVHGIAADVASPDGRQATLQGVLDALGGLDVLINNAGGVRAGRLEQISEADIRTMIEVDLLAPIFLTRAALPALRASGEAMVVNIASSIALIGAPFYATYAAAKAGLAHFGESLRRELKGEGIHVLTAYPSATETPMMQSNRAGPDLGFSRESAAAVADAIVDGIMVDAFDVIRGGEARAQMVALNREDPASVDERFLGLKPALEDAVKDHNAL
ncbi:MAG: SDR family NAD(P)-dependent oxidoreductase [Rhodospirillaceae bacterium]|nr:MAG: SDR family NAD(P)-dependent oxidoreductase [Rhodospirillaceae bacterium]